jgi:hypothetical protein
MRCGSGIAHTIAVVSFSLAMLPGWVTPAAAGPYLGLGIGTAPSLGDGMASFTSASRSGRLLLGQRLGPLAVEGAVAGFRLQGPVTRSAPDGLDYESVSLSGGARLFINLQGPLDAFARGGVERTWLSTSAAAPSYRGDGMYYGAGVEMSLSLPLGSTALWLDYTRHQSTLTGNSDEIESSSGVWTVGLSVGI